MQKSLYQSAEQEILYQTADAGVCLSDSGCRSISIRQRRQESLYKTAEALYQTADVSLSDRGCGRLLYQTADAEVSLSNSGCRSLSIRQLMQKTLYQTVAASDRVYPASAV